MIKAEVYDTIALPFGRWQRLMAVRLVLARQILTRTAVPMHDDFAELAILDRDGPRKTAKIVREHNLLAVRHYGDMANAASK